MADDRVVPASVIGSNAITAAILFYLHHRLKQDAQGLSKIDRRQVTNLARRAGYERDELLLAQRRGPEMQGNAAYYSSGSESGLRGTPQFNRDVRDYGRIEFGPSTRETGTLAHELGHATIDRDGGLSGFNQRHLRPITSAVSGPLSFLAGMSVGLGTGNPLYGALAGAGAGALTSLPTLINEAQATGRAGALMQQIGMPEGSRARRMRHLGQAFNTYLAGALVPGAAAGAISGIMSKRGEHAKAAITILDEKDEREAKIRPGGVADPGLIGSALIGIPSAIAGIRLPQMAYRALQGDRPPPALDPATPAQSRALVRYENPDPGATSASRDPIALMEQAGRRAYSNSSPVIDAAERLSIPMLASRIVAPTFAGIGSGWHFRSPLIGALHGAAAGGLISAPAAFGAYRRGALGMEAGRAAGLSRPAMDVARSRMWNEVIGNLVLSASPGAMAGLASGLISRIINRPDYGDEGEKRDTPRRKGA